MQEAQAIAAMSALALHARFRAVQLLLSIGAEGLAAGEIARRLKIRQSTMSDHLQILARAQILSAERRSQSVIYRADPEAVDALLTYLRGALNGSYGQDGMDLGE